MDRDQSELRLSVVGGGFVGLTTAITFAERGFEVELVEADARRLGALREGQAPFFEPGLDEALSALLAQEKLSLSQKPSRPAEIVFICVGTPEGPGGRADLSSLENAAHQLARAASSWPVAPTIVTKSTVPPGTGRSLLLPALERIGSLGSAFGLASNPEFLREGSALADARAPDRVVVGPFDPMSAARLRRLYAGSACPYVETTPETAETIKYVANAFLATKISFANEIANVCEPLGINVDDVMPAVGLDARIGQLFLRSGLGFGGSCFPKDVAAFASLAREMGAPSTLLEAVLDHNRRQPLRAIALAHELVGPLRGKKVALLGLAFKPHTSDVRETRALPIYQALVAAGAEVTCCDPVAGPAFETLAGPIRLETDVREALRGKDLAIVHTEWPDFRSVEPEEFLALMRRPAVVDGRRALDGPKLRAAGVEYRAVGVGIGGKR